MPNLSRKDALKETTIKEEPLGAYCLQKMWPHIVVASSFMFSKQMLQVNWTSRSGLGGGSTKPGLRAGGREDLPESGRRLFTPCKEKGKECPTALHTRWTCMPLLPHQKVK